MSHVTNQIDQYAITHCQTEIEECLATIFGPDLYSSPKETSRLDMAVKYFLFANTVLLFENHFRFQDNETEFCKLLSFISRPNICRPKYKELKAGMSERGSVLIYEVFRDLAGKQQEAAMKKGREIIVSYLSGVSDMQTKEADSAAAESTLACDMFSRPKPAALNHPLTIIVAAVSETD